MPDTLASLDRVSAAYDGAPALDEVCLDLPDGRIIAFCGPNGSGKSTALKVMRGLHRPDAGNVEIAGRALGDWSQKDLARQVAMLSQSPDAPSDLSVEDLVLMGRFAHRQRTGLPATVHLKSPK